ncbi:solute carrier family 49 member A3 [Synchiropus splendidus]|uniref:solute carrier family 49 member A3 n=1 Tax=Synchiropus splendidus TaxID=270530 RepID=UPI00237E5591|nr:solute carrier family 49 member A3 [Synchiropus splendidus]
MPAGGDGWTPSQEVDASSGGSRTVNSEMKKLVALRVYKRRWFVLLLLCLLNCSNGTIWLTFAPVADQSAQFLGVTSEQINWLSLVFMVVAIPVSFGTTWMLETLGLRFTLILGAWLNMLGGFVRVIGAVWPSFPVVMSGQTLGALAQPLIIFTPTKLAAHWFPDHQRATANMIASMSNPLGILLANIVSPLVAGRPQQIPPLLLVYAVPTGLICFLTTFGLRSSVPPTPPSVSAELSCSEPFLSGLKLLLKNRSYLVLLVAIGSGLAVFTCVSSLLEQILCVHGYSDDFAGLCGALLIVSGIVGAGLLGFYVDRTKNFIEATKINMSFTALSGIAFSVVSLLPQQKVAIAAVCSLFGFFGFSIYPVAMELSVECSYPVGEATSTGLIFISGQILSVLYMVLLQGLTKPIASSLLSTCGGAVLSWKVPLLVMSGLCSFFTCFFVIFFHTRYRRLEAEEDATYRGEHADVPATSERPLLA